MRVYLDTSALLKRVFIEVESVPMVAALDDHVSQGASLLSSSLAWVEVSRTARAYVAAVPTADSDEMAEAALAGVLEQSVTPGVVALARRLYPPVLRSLAAVHLASALVVGADLLIAYDRRLLDAASQNGIKTSSPKGRPG